MNIIKMKDYDEMSYKACELMVDRLQKLESPVFGLATGSTPEGLYQLLVEKYKKKEMSFKDVTTFNLDEYIGLSADHPNSYHHYMKERLFQHVDISHNKTYLPDGIADDLEQECLRFEQLISDAQGIDLQVLGLGTNGHIGFNEPGTAFNSRTAIVDLAQETLDANERFFDSVEEIPTKAITMGIGSIMEGKEMMLLVSGAAKAPALANIINGKITESFPASILQKHPNVTIIADAAALAEA